MEGWSHSWQLGSKSRQQAIVGGSKPFPVQGGSKRFESFSDWIHLDIEATHHYCQAPDCRQGVIQVREQLIVTSNSKQQAILGSEQFKGGSDFDFTVGGLRRRVRFESLRNLLIRILGLEILVETCDSSH
eukprot:scaffold169289_cov53-Attheya_sp.AAC.5